MSTEASSPPPPPPGLIVAAFIAVYLIWGSTYLGIRIAVATLPPFLMGGARFLIAGTILYAWLRLKGIPNPALSHWRNAALIGTLLLGIGNGGVCWAEQYVTSSIAALLIAATPLWFALLDWLRPGGTRPSPQTLCGVLIGFVGVALLVGNRDALQKNAIVPAGAIALLLAGLCWASGSLYARYTPKPRMPLMGIALQMITGGGALLFLGLLTGEPAALRWSAISPQSLGAFIYLTLIGSLVGFTAYSWLLKVTTPARLSTYAYVNPIIAVFLGWIVANETLTPRILCAAAVILAGVMIILIRNGPTTSNLPSPSPSTPAR